jgi:hypothetical protein
MDAVECLTIQISIGKRMFDRKLDKGWKGWWKWQLSPTDMDMESERLKSGSDYSEDTE